MNRITPRSDAVVFLSVVCDILNSRSQRMFFGLYENLILRNWNDCFYIIGTFVILASKHAHHTHVHSLQFCNFHQLL